MSDKDKIPSRNTEEKGIEENAINKKQNQSDGREINHQQKQKQEKHQPRDNA